MRDLACLVFLLALMSTGAASGGGLDFDAVCFFGNDSLTYCEANVAAQREALIYTRAGDDSMIARFSIVCSILDSGFVLRSDTLDTADIVDSARAQSHGAYFPYVFRYLLPPGQYEFLVEMIQPDWSDTTRLMEAVSVPEIRESNGISEIALGAELAFGAEPSTFTRNGVRFVPNPSNFYGSGMPMLYYYAECYGLDTSRADDSVTVIRSVISGASGTEAKKSSERKLAVRASSIVIADGFPAYTMTTGTYVLNLTVQQAGHSDRTVSRKFWIYRPEDFEAGRELALDSAYHSAIVTGGHDIIHTIDPDSALALMEYLLTKQEIRRARDMDPDGKRRYLLEFWRRQAPDDPDAANRYFARVAEANRRYGFLDRMGWRTDRGRVLITLGEPDLIDRRYAEAQGPDHEVWSYERVEGGVLYVFMDRAGFGDLDLVHSTKRGEIYNPDWMNSIQNRSSVTRGLRE